MEQLLAKMGCDQLTWYQTHGGNHIRRILRIENIDAIFELLPDSQENRNVKRAMIGLSKLMSCSESRYYSDQEIDIVEEILKVFIADMKVAFPKESCTVKLHMLIYHLIPYMRRHHSWGKSSEQGIEHVHAQFNKLKQLFLPIRNLRHKARLILQELSIHNWLFDTGSWIE